MASGRWGEVGGSKSAGDGGKRARSPGSNCVEVDQRSAGLKAGAARPRLRRLTALTPSAHRSVGFASARSRAEPDMARSLAQRAATGTPSLTTLIHGVLDDYTLHHAG